MKPKPSVVHLLPLPNVAKMEAVDTGAAGRDAAADRVGWGAGWAMARRIGRDGVRARELHTACVARRRGSSVWMDMAFGEG